jgi:S-formylglutathione hydrolase FrmB
MSRLPRDPVVFGTVEISDPRFEVEGLREMTVRSPALGRRADLTVWVSEPATHPGSPVPLIVLLHGVYGSHWAWTRRAGAHRVARGLIDSGELPPCVIAMPSDGLRGDGSGYLPNSSEDVERWIVDEVPAAAQQAAPLVDSNSPVCIAGLSMGGFAALRLGARHGDRFTAAAGLSSITDSRQLTRFVSDGPYVGRLVEDTSLASALVRHRAHLPPIRFDCGVDDSLIDGNRRLHAALVEAEIGHEYEEFAGGHGWGYWEQHLPDVFRFFARQLTRG